MTRERLEGLVLGLCIAWGMACTNMQPMVGTWKDLGQDDVVRMQTILPGITEEQIRDDTRVTVIEARVPCARLMEVCWAGMTRFQKALGSIPLSCTQTFQHAWRDETGKIVGTEKTAFIYSCWMTPSFVRNHELGHARGERHAWW